MGYRVRQGAHFYPFSFNALNLFESNNSTQGNLKSLLHIGVRKGTRRGGKQSGLSLLIREEVFLALEQ